MSKFYTNVALIGDDVCVRMIDGDQRKQFKDSYNPTIYLHAKEKTAFKSIEQRYLQPFQPGTIKETRKFVNEYKDVDGFSIYGHHNYALDWIANNFSEEKLDYDKSRMVIYSFDIETEAENGFPDVETAAERINVITLKDVISGKIYVFGLEDYGVEYIPHLDNIEYRGYEDEESLLEGFLDFWTNRYPDVVFGYNSDSFDIPYIVNRIQEVLGRDAARKLSPWGRVDKKTFSFRHRDYNGYTIAGVTHLDYLRMYWKYVLEPRENYKLDYIAEIETGKKKVDHTEYATFREFYRGDFQKFVEYNVEDVILVDEIDKKRKLLDLTISTAYLMHVNHEDVMSQVRCWEQLIYCNLKRKGIIPKFKDIEEKSEQFMGAFVKEPKPGMYKWIVSLDVNSMYPNLISTLNIGLETFVKKVDLLPHDILDKTERYTEAFKEAKELGYSLGANGTMYRTNEISFFSEPIQKMYKGRVAARKKIKELEKQLPGITDKVVQEEIENEKSGLDIFQMTAKVAMNSNYGSMGSPYYSFYNVDNAEAVTSTGQFVIQYVERRLNRFLSDLLNIKGEYVFYVDTDSNYVTIPDEFISKVCEGKSLNQKITFIDNLCKQYIQPELTKIFEEIIAQLNAIPGFLEMKREAIADRAIFQGKKRYLVNIWDDEGKRLKEPKLKCQGMEIKKTVVPKFCRDKMEQAVKMIFAGCTNDDMIGFIKEIRAHFFSLSVEEISFPKGVGDMDKYFDDKTLYTKGTPLHFRAVMQYNKLIKKNKLDRKYQYIKEGEKVRLLYLKEPNPTKDKAIAFLKEFPKEFELHKYVDVETQFEKAFLGPLKAILNVIGWDTEKRSSLSRFM